MTSADHQLIDRLLYQAESPALDFKRDQYLFAKADDTTKSELLKDILAFANSWRESTAYILIGVQEVKGPRSKVVGVTHHLDDANLQQFVNSKVQRPLVFSYRPIQFEGADLGMIEIPKQKRPFYVNQQFGKVKENSVYLRRGSSTVIATLDEIVDMGEANTESTLHSTPKLVLEWADIKNRTVIPSTKTIESSVLEPALNDDAFYPLWENNRASQLIRISSGYNELYCHRMIVLSAKSHLLSAVGLRLRNEGESAAKNVIIRGSIAKQKGIEFGRYINHFTDVFNDAGSWCTIPVRSGGPPIRNVIFSTSSPICKYDEAVMQIEGAEDRWSVHMEIASVRPGDEFWSSEPFYIGSKAPLHASLEGEIRGENIPEPIPFKLDLNFSITRRPMEIEDVSPHLSEEYQ